MDDKNQCSNACIKGWQWIFVAPSHTGGFGGVAGADSWCQQAAQSAALPGDYRAWLSTGVYAPDSGFLKYNRPYYLKNFDGTKVEIAADWKQLVDGALSYPINAYATGEKVPLFNDPCHASRLVWSNTTTSGSSASGSHCFGFGSGSGNQQGRVGRLDTIDGEWTFSVVCGTKPCNASLHVYCVEQ